MKRFNELTESQQATALEYTFECLKDGLLSGVLLAKDGVATSDENLRKIARNLVEDVFFQECGEMILDDSEGMEEV